MADRDSSAAVGGDTAQDDYAERLQLLQRVWWKRLLPVQAPYQWNIRRQRLGRTIEIGCGIGRNMASLGAGSIGVDHNELAVRLACASGFKAYTLDQWEQSAERVPGSFDALLISHVLEHIDEAGARQLLLDYLPYLRPGGKVMMICPQEKGYASDATHVRFTDGAMLTAMARDVGLAPRPWYSFPFPRWAGQAFIYNEFCLVAVKP